MTTTTRELTEDEKKMVNEFFGGDEECDQKRYWLMSEADMAAERRKNNVMRPSFYGSLIHDLLTTCAVLSKQLFVATMDLQEAKTELARKKIVIEDLREALHESRERS